MHKSLIAVPLLAVLLCAGTLTGQESEGCARARRLQPTSTLSRSELCALLTRALETNTDALYVTEEGRPVLDYRSERGERPIHIMSVTKSVAALAVGRMLLDGELDSLGVRVADVYPEWRQGRKREITIRHLLTHTSGLQDVPNAGLEIEPAPDAVQLALAAELSADPGARFQYNNKAVNLLAGIVQRLAGRPLDEYLGATVFADVEIDEFDWIHDSAGDPYVMAGLSLRAEDLAKIGRLLMFGGRWERRQVIDAKFARAAVTNQHDLYPTHGYLWWLIPEWRRYVIDAELLGEWRAARVDERVVRAGEALLNREIAPSDFRGALTEQLGHDGFELWQEETVRAGLRGRRTRAGPIVGFEGNGWLGQWIVVYPEADVVAVRLIDRSSWREEADGFADFIELVGEVVRPDR